MTIDNIFTLHHWVTLYPQKCMTKDVFTIPTFIHYLALKYIGDIGGNTVHTNDTSIIAPLVVEWDPKSPCFIPNL